MKKKIYFLVTFIALALSYSFSVYAADTSFTYAIPNPSRYDSLEEVISAAASLIQPLFVLTGGGFFFYAGWIRLKSKGNAEEIAKSWAIIQAVIGGLVIFVLGPSILGAVLGALGIEGFLLT